jgi:transposase
MRIRAVRQIVEEGVHPEDVVAVLGLARSTVFGWVRQYREGGEDALLAKPIPGRPTKLTDAERRRLVELITNSDPRQLQFEFALWTREMIAELIWQQFAVRLSVSAVGRLLRRLGFSPQRPTHRAYEQSGLAVEEWKTITYPAIQAEAAQAGAIVYFADESSVRSDYHSGTTWAPVGTTPVVEGTGARFKVNMISAVSAQGRLRFWVIDDNLTAPRFIEFCRRLLHDSGDRPVFLIVDGHPAHRAKTVKTFVASTNGRLRLFFLPGYSPQLNPDEWVWKNVKHDRIGRTRPTTRDDLKANVISALRRLQKLPGLIRGFFRDPNLRYITTAQQPTTV